jgi:hypothetical protein
LKCPGCGGELVKRWKNASRYECRNPTCAVIEVRVVGKGVDKKFIVLRDAAMSKRPLFEASRRRKVKRARRKRLRRS